MLPGAQCNGTCECANVLTEVDVDDDRRCKKVDLEAACKKDNGCLLIYNQDSVECHEQYAEKIYQKFTNVCRRGSINNEHFLNENDKDVTIESLEQYSAGIESNCTSIGTQTPSVQDANIQTTPSLESLCESPSEHYDKFNSCSHARIRNFINYSRLDGSTKASSIESSVRDESTQYCDSCESDHKSKANSHFKSQHSSCCSWKEYCYVHDPFFPKDRFCDDVRGDFCWRNENFSHKTHRCHCVNDHLHYSQPEIKNHVKRRYHISSSPDSAQLSYVHMPAICHCFNDYGPKAALEYCEPKKSSVQAFAKPEKFDEILEETKTKVIAQNHVSILKQQKVKEECKIEVLDEKEKHKLNSSETKVFKVIKKAKSFDGINLEMEQRKPLLSDLLKSKDNESKNNSDENYNDDDDEEENAVDENEKLKPTTECPNGTCHCMHEVSPESMHSRCIQIRPSSKKSSKRTSPLKIITFMLFGSAILITGSAIKDAYYQ